ncbi:MAG TPA: GTPase [Planctomycetota bacterium]|nr:GTPase [Planctomycetota bacterium]
MPRRSSRPSSAEPDTIVAPATPSGGGLRAVVRVGGPRAVELAGARPGAVVFRAPRSYTREDLVEIHLPASPPLVDRLVRDLLEAGARPARPGEFTLRAFLHGRLDLAQAEAVERLVAAEDEAERRAALRQLEGEFSRRLGAVEQACLDLAADAEAALDFSEEDIEIVTTADAGARAGAALRDLRALIADTAARPARDGRPVVVLHGRPNAGKSTLFNALAGQDAIVSPTAGTTRDLLEADADLGVPVRLVDAAGVAEGQTGLDAEGARRARDAAASADLVLFVVDPSDPAERPRGWPCVVVESKADLHPGPAPPGALRVSARTGEGLAALRRAVGAALDAGVSTAAFSVSARQRALLREAEEALARVPGAAAAGLELAALELRSALAALGAVTGRDVGEELLDRVFSRFCLGK